MRMRMVRSERRILLAVLAALLIATAWIGSGAHVPPALPHVAEAGHAPRESGGTVSAVDVSDAVVAPMLGVARTAEPRQAPLWILPGLAAALATLCLFRRQRLRPALLSGRKLLRGSRSNRAPPLASFA
jgi:hypothetical protein